MNRIILAVLSFVFLFFSCNTGSDSKSEKSTKTKKETTKDAIAYNNNMNIIHSHVDFSFNLILEAIDENDYQKALLSAQNTLLKIDQGKQIVNELKDFDGNDEFKTEMMHLLTVYEEIIKNEIGEIIALIASNEEISFDMLKIKNEYYGAALDKYDDAVFAFIEYQKAFAKKWNFQLEEIKN